ncbi:tub-1 [Pristionchus pacificus]|uniref:Tubby-like protein n=1 Tax=Pristionchus pacificus TaxID=54126 RepID=A0A8R1Y9I7_PRIPA|nr:tub-1 [Pristionchus pacificus]
MRVRWNKEKRTPPSLFPTCQSFSFSVMESTKNDWMNETLHRQRLLLEERQRQKRISSGGIRSSPFDVSSRPTTASSLSSTLSSFSTHPLIDLSPSSPLTYSSINVPSTHPLDVHSQFDGSTRETDPSINTLTMSSTQSEGDPENEEDFECGRVAVSPRIEEKNGIVEETMLPMKEPDYEKIMKNLEEFVRMPAEEGVTYKCIINRDKNGMDKGMFPTYYLHLESNNKKKIFLLAARKRKKCKTANYLISTDPTRLLRTGEGFIGKVRSNAIGTSFTVYDEGKNPKHNGNSELIRAELAAVIYDQNFLGFRGPRKMTILTPGLSEGKEVLKIRPVAEKDTLLERYKSRRLDNVVKMTNKAPLWSEESQSFVLNFHGRVTQASVKNFQIVHEQDEEYVVMQFGRVSHDMFSMDFRYPLSAVQAFGIAMTSFHGKIACE